MALAPAVAQSADIAIHHAQHATDYIVRIHDGPINKDDSLATTSPTPIDNGLEGGSPRIYARGKANPLFVETATSAVPESWVHDPYVFTQATATTVLSFAPTSDSVVPLTLAFSGSSLAFYSDGLASLHDRTADLWLFSYTWSCCTFHGNVPWEPRPGPLIWNGAKLASTPLLLASHEYELTLMARTYGNLDGQSVAINLSGLQVVTPPAPEPEAYAMTLFGLCVVWFLSRHRKDIQA